MLSTASLAIRPPTADGLVRVAPKLMAITVIGAALFGMWLPSPDVSAAPPTSRPCIGQDPNDPEATSRRAEIERDDGFYEFAVSTSGSPVSCRVTWTSFDGERFASFVYDFKDGSFLEITQHPPETYNEHEHEHEAPGLIEKLRAFLIASIVEIDRQGVPVTPAVDTRGLAAAKRPVTVVVRIHGSRPSRDQTLAPILAVIERWRAAGVEVVGVEVDHDCATAALPDYADWLAAKWSTTDRGRARVNLDATEAVSYTVRTREVSSMSQATADAYLVLAADDRFEARLPRRLKRDAEAAAKAHGESLSQYVLRLLAEKVADEFPATQEWALTPAEQAQFIRVLAGPVAATPALARATTRAEEVFGPAPKL